MAVKFPLDKLLPGMILNASIIFQGGVLLSKGATVTEQHLKRMKTWGVDAFETQEGYTDFQQVVRERGAQDWTTGPAPGAVAPPPKYIPPGYEIDNGATYVVENSITYTDEPISMDQHLVIQGTIGEDVELESKGNIQIAGEIQPGAKVIAKGDVVVRGTILGTKDKPASVRGQTVTAVVAEHALIHAYGTLSATSLRHCTASAGTEIIVTDETIGILGGETEAGYSIKAGAAKGTPEGHAVLRVQMTRQKQLFQAMTRAEKTIAEKELEFSKLEKVIEVIRLLGDKVVTLPPEKKQELALQSRRYMELKNELAQLRGQMEAMRDETEEEVKSMDACPIKITQVWPGIDIALGTGVLKLNARQSATGYYQKSGRILAFSERT